jgi:protein toll
VFYYGLLENRQRVIIILHGVLPPTDSLDTDLQKYLKSNTAIRSDDPWFWQKLRYALPKKKQKRKRSPSSDTQVTDVSESLYKTQISKQGLI